MLLFKLIILGDAGVGKTSFMNMYLNNEFNEHESSTIGVEFGSKTIPIGEFIRPELMERYDVARKNHLITVPDKYMDILKLQIWGCSGQERFHSIVKSYYRNVKGVVFVCDLTRRVSLENVQFWIDDFKKNSNKEFDDINKILVANKSDLDNLIEISEQEIQELAEKHDMKYYFVSSKKEVERVGEIFEDLGNQVFEKYLDVPDDDLRRMQYISGIALNHHHNSVDDRLLLKPKWRSKCCF